MKERTRLWLYCIGIGGLAMLGWFGMPNANADPYCFVPIGQYKNTCDPTYLWPQTNGNNGVPGTFGPDGQYTPQGPIYPPFLPDFGPVLH